MKPISYYLVIHVIIIHVIIICIYIFWFLKANKNIKEENQKIKKNEILLLLIPVFSFFWIFYVITKLNQSIFKEITDRNILEKEYKNHKISLSSGFIYVSVFIPLISYFALFFFLIDNIMLRQRIRSFHKLINNT